MSFEEILRKQLKFDEGVRLTPFIDTVGKTTIGVGRNLTDVGISQDECDHMLENDMRGAIVVARVLFPTFDKLTDMRKAVVCNMAFNLGQTRLSLFHTTIQRVTSGDYIGAADSMLNSLWAKQVGNRAKRLANQMRVG